MIGWNHLVEIKRIEKLSLPSFPPPHHALLPLMPSPPTESRIVSRLNESFATQSGVKRTSLRTAPKSETHLGHLDAATGPIVYLSHSPSFQKVLGS